MSSLLLKPKAVSKSLLVNVISVSVVFGFWSNTPLSPYRTVYLSGVVLPVVGASQSTVIEPLSFFVTLKFVYTYCWCCRSSCSRSSRSSRKFVAAPIPCVTPSSY